jgi:hypothetical protein
MFDSSLHAVASRPAKAGDRLVSTKFANSVTRGFAAIGEPTIAVCLLPGTELAFEQEVASKHFLGDLLPRSRFGKLGTKVARFCQLKAGQPHVHHDALEFPNGLIMRVTRLRTGQRAKVLQLPATANVAVEAGTHARGSLAAR